MHIILHTAVLALAAGAGAMTGWDTAGMTSKRPALSYFEEGRPRLVLTCKDTHTNVQIRGFDAAQRWPQPMIEVTFGGVKRLAQPDLQMVGDQTAFSFQFPISDSVLKAIRNGAPVSATYRGQTHRFPVALPSTRSEFADKCAALVPPVMRRS